jgi:hypothetical protein
MMHRFSIFVAKWSTDVDISKLGSPLRVHRSVRGNRVGHKVAPRPPGATAHHIEAKIAMAINVITASGKPVGRLSSQFAKLFIGFGP